METVTVYYDGVSIEMHLTQVEEGSWRTDFTLIENYPNTGRVTYDTRALAKQETEAFAIGVVKAYHGARK